MTRSAWPIALPNRDWLGARDRVILAAQASAILIIALYEAVEIAGMPWPLKSREIAPITLFVIPMLYVIRGFRAAAAAATTAWTVALVALSVGLERQGLERWADGLQVALIGTVGVFVGYRVQHEMLVRRRAEAAQEALRVSEARYRALFEQSQTPTFVVNADGRIRQANAAAAALFVGPRHGVGGEALADVLGVAAARQLLAGKPPPALLRTMTDGDERVLRPHCTAVVDANGDMLWQIVLQDVTEERWQRRRMDAYAASVLRGQEEERRRIAHELHDEPVQELIHVCRRLDGVAQRVALPSATIADLEQTRQLTERIAQSLRDLARGLRPPSLDDLGLVVSLRQLFAKFEGRTGIAATFDILGVERRLEPDIELGLYRIAQEALRNVERHAAARHVTARITFGRGVRLRVYDDGIGFRPPVRSTPGAETGLGVLGMQERAMLVGARFAIRSTPRVGTVVRVVVPAPSLPPLGAGFGVSGTLPRVVAR